MATMTISLPEPLKVFVEEQAARQGFGSAGEYLTAVIRDIQHRQAGGERIGPRVDASDDPALDDLAPYLGPLRAEGMIVEARELEDGTPAIVITRPGAVPASDPLTRLTEALDAAWDAGRLTPGSVEQAIRDFRQAHPYGR